ncbi:MAG: KTSC domain-containing protein [Alphaproteobacteria bacterium]|nr:KTSC domain-containing protein [Alphaproteobacteria bacterium]
MFLSAYADRIPVESSNLKSVGFDSGVLVIEFKSGSIYEYSDVPANVHSELMKAKSKGKYFHKNIKNTYEFKRIK